MLQAGDYVVTIMDHFGADFSVLFVAACECIAVMWVYGKMLRRVGINNIRPHVSRVLPFDSELRNWIKVYMLMKSFIFFTRCASLRS